MASGISPFLFLLLVSRPYFPVAIADLPKTTHTHVQVTGKVTYVLHEADGDTHIRIEDGKGHFAVAECIPVLPCSVPKVGQAITVWGISREDKKHVWWEVHPVERLRVE